LGANFHGIEFQISLQVYTNEQWVVWHR